MIELIGHILRKLSLIDYAKIPDLIRSGRKPAIIEAMQLLGTPKASYVSEDKEQSKPFWRQ